MSDLDDAVDAEIRTYTPGVAPSFAVLVDRRRRRDRRVALGSGAVVLAVMSAATVVIAPRLLSHDDALQPSVPSTAPEGTATDLLVIDCEGAGPTLPNGDRVVAQADGVHYTFRNQTDFTMHTSFALGGDAVAPHSTVSGTTSRATPGALWWISCSDDIETLREHARSVFIDDPNDFFVHVPECNGPTSITDFGQPLKGDPVELTLRSHAEADVVGYPQGRPRLIYAGDQLISWEGVGDGWVPSQTTRCDTGVVGQGIKAPPPTQLTRTDEFGVVKAVRSHGAVIEVDVDRVDMLGGAEAKAAAAAAGTDVSNDYFLRNDSPALRTYQVSPNVIVWGNIAMLHQEPGAHRTTLTRWEQFVATPAAMDTLFHFETTHGVVTGIEEQYRP